MIYTDSSNLIERFSSFTNCQLCNIYNPVLTGRIRLKCADILKINCNINILLDNLFSTEHLHFVFCSWYNIQRFRYT